MKKILGVLVVALFPFITGISMGAVVIWKEFTVTVMNPTEVCKVTFTRGKGTLTGMAAVGQGCKVEGNVKDGFKVTLTPPVKK